MDKYFDKIFSHLESIGYEKSTEWEYKKILTDKLVSFVHIDWAEAKFICRSIADAPTARVMSDQVRTFEQLRLIAIEDIAKYVEIMAIQATTKLASELVIKDYTEKRNIRKNES